MSITTVNIGMVIEKFTGKAVDIIIVGIKVVSIITVGKIVSSSSFETFILVDQIDFMIDIFHID